MIDWRRNGRAIAIFKSADVKASDGIHFVTVRNISEVGACLEAYPGVAQGDHIEFCFDSAGLRKGVVAWVGAGRFGVRAEPIDAAQKTFSLPHSPRSVRLPLSLGVKVFIEGRKAQGALRDLSMRGTCISGINGLMRGQLLTIEIGSRSFEQATVRWVDQGRAGVLFVKPMSPADFREFVDSLQGRMPFEPGKVAESR